MTANHTIDEVTQALRANRGLMYPAARQLGITRQALQQRVKKTITLQEVIAESRASFVDVAEQKLGEAVDNSDAWAVQFVLRTLGRDRGYAERIDITVTIAQERERVRSSAEAEGLDADLAVAEFERMIKDGAKT